MNNLLNEAAAEIGKITGESPLLDAELILCSVLKISREKLYSSDNLKLDSEQKRKYLDGIKMRMQGKPVAYITGYKEFYERLFCVTEYTLIPRPETELLVEKAAFTARNAAKEKVDILDVGTGCGNIIISLAGLLKESKYKFSACDISPEALNTAVKNAKVYGDESRIEFAVSDLFGGFNNDRRFDIIISNPPYIAESEYDELSAEVKCEPYGALVSGGSGLEIISRLIEESFDRLNPGGNLMFEIGHGQSDPVAKMLEGYGYKEIEFLKDLQGIKRTAAAKK